MKEITREDWVKNPTPRMMWVWDNFEENKHKNYVVYILTKEEMKKVHIGYPVVTADGRFSHCAEIEELKLERMTNKGLSWWLHDHPEEHREWKNKYGCMVYNEFSYSTESENEPCHEDVVIRSNGGEWREPYNIPPECISPTPDEIGG